MKHFFITVIILAFAPKVLVGQEISVDIVNEVIAALIGEQDVDAIPEFSSIDEMCKSDYGTCNGKGELIGLDFQFANLNGTIPATISELTTLEYINLEYNYLSGPIPTGLSKMKKLEQLLLTGNFLTAPVPDDLMELPNLMLADLDKNAIDTDDEEAIAKFNITGQVNLDVCRSPDSIYLGRRLNTRNGFIKDEGIEIDTADISIEQLIDKAREMDDKKEENEIFKVVERMPRFPGCEDEETEKERDQCAKNEMLNFIYRNLVYPSLDRERGNEGMVVAQFVVLTDGNVGDVTLVRDPVKGGRLGNASLWVVNRMNYICDPWTPGMQNDRPVKVLYTLPVKFKLQ